MQRIQEAQQQAEQAQQQTLMKEQEARTRLADARTLADQGLGAERYSRIEENKALAVERQAEANKDDQMALLNFVKAMKEIEGMDMAQLERIILLQRTLKTEEAIPGSTAPKATTAKPMKKPVSKTPVKSSSPS
jgi:hypothetical protein